MKGTEKRSFRAPAPASRRREPPLVPAEGVVARCYAGGLQASAAQLYTTNIPNRKHVT